MPALVPPGYTRGSILFIGPTRREPAHHVPDHSAPGEELLLQAFWDEAGSYGARILLVATDAPTHPVAARYTNLFNEWENDSVETLTVNSRSDAMQESTREQIEAVTGILVLGSNHLHLASVLGGTPLAQAIRRANARGKVVAGIGNSARFLCQHMIAPAHPQDQKAPYLHRHMIQFAPGLGLTNRTLLDGDANFDTPLQTRMARLLTAVAHNPFLVGVGLEADTGAIVYADNTLEATGSGSVLIVDASEMTHSNIYAQDEKPINVHRPGPLPLSIMNVKLHLLTHDDTFDLDMRAPTPAPEDDIPSPTDPITSAF